MINLFGCGFSGQINYALHYMDLYRSARQAGINRTFSHKVANGSLTLAEALGDMDMDEESIPGCDDLIDDYVCCDGKGCNDCIPF